MGLGAAEEDIEMADTVVIPSKMDNAFESSTKAPYQLHEKYIISPIKNGFSKFGFH